MYFISHLHIVNVGLAVGLSVGLTFLLLFIGIPICVIVVGVCVANRRSRPIARTHTVATTPTAGTTVVTTAQTASAAAPATQPMQQYYPAEFKTGPQGAPPSYPGSSHAAHPPPVPQVWTPL